MAQAEFLDKVARVFPEEKAGLDLLSVLVIANSTLTLVAEQGCQGAFVPAPATDDSCEVHVRSPWALQNRPTHDNLVVISCQ